MMNGVNAASVSLYEDEVGVLQCENISSDITFQQHQYVHMAPAWVFLSAQPHLNRQKDLVGGKSVLFPLNPARKVQRSIQTNLESVPYFSPFILFLKMILHTPCEMTVMIFSAILFPNMHVHHKQAGTSIMEANA